MWTHSNFRTALLQAYWEFVTAGFENSSVTHEFLGKFSLVKFKFSNRDCTAVAKKLYRLRDKWTQLVRMYCGSGSPYSEPMTSHALGQPTDAATYNAASGGRTSLAAILKVWRHTPSIDAYLLFKYSMRIYLNNPAIFHPNPIWNDGALGFFVQRRPNKKSNKKKNKMSRDVGSVPDPIICVVCGAKRYQCLFSLRVLLSMVFCEYCCCVGDTATLGVF